MLAAPGNGDARGVVVEIVPLVVPATVPLTLEVTEGAVTMGVVVLKVEEEVAVVTTTRVDVGAVDSLMEVVGITVDVGAGAVESLTEAVGI